MIYLTNPYEIKTAVAELATERILWLDTEVADYNTHKPRLSLIQVLAISNPGNAAPILDLTGESVYVLDVLDQRDVVADFINQIMVNPQIEKVFHNASYDVNFLGKKQAKNVTCTLEIAKKIPYYLLPLKNLKLQTLAEKLGQFSPVNKTEQKSDWGQRPLSEQQLSYAKMDVVYLAKIHQSLLEIQRQSHPDPAQENLTILTQRYQEIEHHWKLLDSEINHLQERLKKAMQAQNQLETSAFKLAASERTTLKTEFSELVKLVQANQLPFDFTITITQKMQQELGAAVDQLSLQVENTSYLRLTTKNSADAEESDSLHL